MGSVFLSYSRKDHNIMNDVRRALLDAGSTVWTDEALSPGTPVWQRTIEAQISSASCLVVLLSPSAKDSDWVRAEITRARLEEVNIVPVLIRGKRTADILPLGLENANWIDIRSNRAGGLVRLVDTVSKFADGSQTQAEIFTPQVSSAAREGPIDDSHNWQSIGRVLQYYSMVDAAGIEISAPIREGDLLFFGEGRNGVLQRIETIERNRRRVQSAQPGEQVGVRVWNPVATGDGVEKAMDADRATLVGEVSHFYSNLSVVGIMLENSLAIGDRIEIRGPHNRFVQTVRSIEVNHQRRNRAGAGDSIGLAVILQATEGDRVYRFV